jgi:hypothetical protein
LVLAYEEKLLGTEDVVEACLDRYRSAGIPAREVRWESLSLSNAAPEHAPVIITDGRLDWVLPPNGQPGDHVSLFRRLAADEWTIHILLPLEALGEAHRALRTTPVFLQGWWADEGGVQFGRPEIP